MMYKFTSRAEKALEIANDIAVELGHTYIGSEHILYGLVAEGTGVASMVLESQGVTKEAVLARGVMRKSSNGIQRIILILIKSIN